MEKVNSQIKRQLMEIISKEVDDPDMDFLSITRVETTSDLRESKVYFSLLDETKYENARAVLEKMNKFIRHHLGKRIRMKFLPQLKFLPDDSIKYSVDIFQKIEEVRRQDDLKHKENNPNVEESDD
jgi:ribosome-binding factor A